MEGKQAVSVRFCAESIIFNAKLIIINEKIIIFDTDNDGFILNMTIVYAYADKMTVCMLT